jgi:hypothetical protein
MGSQDKGKVNRLADLLEEGLLAPTSWLEEHDYSRPLLGKYVASGWLESPARGVYRRPGPPLKWQHVVASLQLLQRSYLHVGGGTALVQRGLGHYVQMGGAQAILLYGPEGLPSWVDKLGLKARFSVRPDAMFGALRARRDDKGVLRDFNERPIDARKLDEMGLREVPWGAWDWKLVFSTDERAILELLQDVPARESVYEADVLLQGLANLRPQRLMGLLKACTSVKVKRLFLALAERHGHGWFKHLDPAKLDLGSGKRMLVQGGKLHPKYLVTLPADLDAHAR